MASSWTSLRNDEITAELIHKHLCSSQSDYWVAAACFDRSLEDVAIQRILLELGLERTQLASVRSKAAFADTAGDSSDQQDPCKPLISHFQREPLDAQMCEIRVTLLDRLDRLNTYAELSVELLPEDVKDEGDEEWEDDPWAEAEVDAPNNINLKQPTILLPDFLTNDLLQTALHLASQRQFNALQTLVQRHGPSLLPYRFIILESIPEHSHPSEFRQLLPSYDSSAGLERLITPNPWRSDLDWTETQDVRAALRAVEVEPLEPAGEFTCGCPGPLSGSALLDWYTQRISTIITSTGMVDIALALTQHGASSGLEGLDEIGEDLSLLSRLVYDTPLATMDDRDLTLGAWRAMTPREAIQSYLAQSKPNNIAQDIRRLVTPYLFVLESRAERSGHPDPSLHNQLLFDYIINSPLEVAAAVFEASKPTLSPSQRLIKDDEDMARLALASLYGSDSLDDWATMSRIFECLPAWESAAFSQEEEGHLDTTIASLGAFIAPSTTRPRCTPNDLLAFFQPLGAPSLSRALDFLDMHLESGEILSRWNVPAPLRWFLQSMNDESEQRSWAHRMSRRAGGSSDEPDSPEEYEWLLEDMLKLSGTSEGGLKGAFGLISREDITGIFFSGLLNSGKFNIAKQLLHAPRTKISLDTKTIEDICLSCSREFYDNSSSGNYKFGDMNTAYNCLSVPHPSDRIVKEREFIEATSRICSFNIMSRPGIPISPIEIRLTKDRLSLVSRVLSSNTDAYKHTEVILDLVYKLGFKGDATAEVKTLAMISDVALQNEDFTWAYQINERIIQTVQKLGTSDHDAQEAKEVCWVACFQLGRQSEFPDAQKKLSLLGHALELCPPERITEILAAWRKLDQEDVDAHKEGFSIRPSVRAIRKRESTPTLSLAERILHIPPSPLIHAPDAATLASKTFSRVAANFPFSVGNMDRSAILGNPHTGNTSQTRTGQEGEERIHASRVLQKGIGWLIGADDA